ncbi:MAG TPA: amidohydrolase family protein [Stellaceae bacterium]|jgi:cytosine/adenosine deaminase-related metal-dependent hydrolase|nr:amidohydrolase family protein [Stellaceae bacterium]
MRNGTLNRRGFLTAASAAIAATAASGGNAVAAAKTNTVASAARREYLIRGAAVVSMDASVGDFAKGDIHVRAGAIVAVGPHINAPKAIVIDGANMIALPGLIDTHWHMWECAARNLAGDDEKTGYFPHSRTIGVLFKPEDNARGVRLGLAEAIHSGITTVHNWSHNNLSPEYAAAEVAVHHEAGGRALYSYGYSRKTGTNVMLPLDDIRAFHAKYFSTPGDGLVTFGIATRGPNSNPIEICAQEMAFARELKIPLTTHVGIVPGKDSFVEMMAKANLLGPDVLLIHATNGTDAERQILGETKTPVSCSPFTEMRTGFGVTPIRAFMAAKVPFGLSIDTTVLCGNADMFAIMKVMQNLDDGTAPSEFAITARRVLEMATIDGARVLGIADRVGSLTPGKRADIILVRTDAINMAPMADPTRMIVQAAQPANVDTVLVDGRILKRAGKLTTLDEAKVMREAAESMARVGAQIAKT